MQENKLLYSITDTARTLGLGRTKIYEMINCGDLVSVRLGTRRMIKADSIITLIERATGGAA